MTTYFTINQIKTANKAAGQHFFTPGTMRFFNSRVLDRVYGGHYFVTSEQNDILKSDIQPRRYSVRVVKDNGSIDTVGEFDQYKTAAAAKKAAQALADIDGNAETVGHRYSLKYLQELPTLQQGQFADLKLETPFTRVWLSRLTVADGAEYNHQVMSEQYEGGEWVTVQEYEAK